MKTTTLREPGANNVPLPTLQETTKMAKKRHVTRTEFNALKREIEKFDRERGAEIDALIAESNRVMAAGDRLIESTKTFTPPTQLAPITESTTPPPADPPRPLHHLSESELHEVMMEPYRHLADGQDDLNESISARDAAFDRLGSVWGVSTEPLRETRSNIWRDDPETTIENVFESMGIPYCGPRSPYRRL